jgi:hypothetical protein
MFQVPREKFGAIWNNEVKGRRENSRVQNEENKGMRIGERGEAGR